MSDSERPQRPPVDPTDSRGSRATGQLVLFPVGRDAARPFTVQFDDARTAQPVPPQHPIVLPDGTALRSVPASELDASEQADVFVPQYAPSRLGRVFLFDARAQDSAGLERFEQDRAGVIFRDGQALWENAPVAFGVPRSRRYGRLALGCEAALFFLARTNNGWSMQTWNTGPLVALRRVPEVRSVALVPALWLDLAARALDGANWEDADAPSA